MALRTPILSLPREILSLIIEALANSRKSLTSVGLTCRFLHSLSLPRLLKEVDLCCHNRGRLSSQEDEIRPVIYADYSDEHRSEDLVPRQRAFLRLMTDRPELALHIKSLKWTLVWLDFDDSELTDIDYELWNVFGRMVNVRQLDLASIHDIHDQPFIRKNPPRLFPSVTHLRLVGWMHRGLVDSILNGLNSETLHTLVLDRLQDEGAFPNGAPMSLDINSTYARSLSNAGRSQTIVTYKMLDDDLIVRQRAGQAATFPGPMWTALNTLSKLRCTRLANLEIIIPPIDGRIDLRNYRTYSEELSRFLLSVAHTLNSFTIEIGQVFWTFPYLQPGRCRSRWQNYQTYERPVLSAFVKALLPAFRHPKIRTLASLNLDILPSKADSEDLLPEPKEITGCSEDHQAAWNVLVRSIKTDYHPVFCGYEFYINKQNLHMLHHILEQS